MDLTILVEVDKRSCAILPDSVKITANVRTNLKVKLSLIVHVYPWRKAYRTLHENFSSYFVTTLEQNFNVFAFFYCTRRIIVKGQTRYDIL